MIKIGLCDDNHLYLKELSKLLDKISKNKDISIEIIKFNSGEELINFHNKRKNYFDLIFLDILMKGINGIDTARALKLLCPTTYIIFATISKDYALDSYEVDAYSYILKPYNYDKIESKFLDVLENIINNKKNILYVKNNQDIYSINLNKTIYFESSLRKIISYSLTENISFYDKLSDLENRLCCDNFVRCHRSYLVNLNYVKNIVGSDIITTTNHKIPISKKYLKSIREYFIEYLKSNL